MEMYDVPSPRDPTNVGPGPLDPELADLVVGA